MNPKILEDSLVCYLFTFEEEEEEEKRKKKKIKRYMNTVVIKIINKHSQTSQSSNIIKDASNSSNT